MKKVLMIILILAFVLGLVFVFTIARKRSSEVATSEPVLEPQPSQTISPSPMPTIAPEVPQIEIDLSLIEKDIEKIKREDRRLLPPSFMFDLDLK